LVASGGEGRPALTLFPDPSAASIPEDIFTPEYLRLARKSDRHSLAFENLLLQASLDCRLAHTLRKGRDKALSQTLLVKDRLRPRGLDDLQERLLEERGFLADLLGQLEPPGAGELDLELRGQVAALATVNAANQGSLRTLD
jgi:hypothetical protein